MGFEFIEEKSNGFTFEEAPATGFSFEENSKEVPIPKSALPSRGAFGLGIDSLADLGDAAIDVVKSTTHVPEIPVGLVDLVVGGKAGKALEELGFQPKAAREFLDTFYSQERKDSLKEVENAKGFLGKAAALLENPDVVGGAIVESAAPMLAGGAIARGLMEASTMPAWLAAGAGEGVVGGGMAAESIRGQTGDGLLTPEQSGMAALTGVATGALGAGGNLISKRLGIGDIDTALATGTLANSEKGMLRKGVEGFISEGLIEEMPQSGSERIFENLALGKDAMLGVPEAMAEGLVIGGVTGSAVSLLSSPKGEKTIEQWKQEGQAELAKMLEENVGGINPDYPPNQIESPSAPAVPLSDLAETPMSEDEIAQAKVLEKQTLTGAADMPEDVLAVEEMAGLNERMQDPNVISSEEVAVRKAERLQELRDEDPEMSEDVLARRVEHEFKNELPHDMREIVASSEESSVGLTPRHKAMVAGEVRGIGGDAYAFPPEVAKAMVDTVKLWADRWMPGSKIVLNFDQLSKGSLGAYTQLKSGIHVITPRELANWSAHVKDDSGSVTSYNTYTQVQALYSMSHEFGHALLMHRFGEGIPTELIDVVGRLDAGQHLSDSELMLLPEAQGQVVREYQARINAIRSGAMSAADFVEQWLGTWKTSDGLLKWKNLQDKQLYTYARKVLAADGKMLESSTALDLVHALGRNAKDPNSDAKAEQYVLSFQEYMAEQFSRYAYQKRIDEGTALGKFFANALRTLRSFFREVKTQKGASGETVIAPGIAFEQWVDGLAAVPALLEEKGGASRKARKGKKAKPNVNASIDEETERAMEAVPVAAPEEVLAVSDEEKKRLRERVKQFVDMQDPLAKELFGMIARGEILEVKLWLHDAEAAELKRDFEAGKSEEIPDEDIAELAGLTEKEWRNPKLLAEAAQLWRQLKTKSVFFKRFFGDWENAPGMASKVVDASGEPMIVYHGGPVEMPFFDETLLGGNTYASSARGGFFFAMRMDTADFYAKLSSDPERGGKKREVVHPKEARKAQELRRKIQALAGQIDAAGEEMRAKRVEIKRAEAMITEVPGGWAGIAKARALRKLKDQLEREYMDLVETSNVPFRTKKELEKELAQLEKVEARPVTRGYYLNLRNPLIIEGGGVYQNQYFTDLIAQARAEGRDGVIIRNTADPKPDDTIYIAFESTQIKATKNTGTFDPTDHLHWDKEKEDGLAAFKMAKRTKRLTDFVGENLGLEKSIWIWHRALDAVRQVQQAAHTSSNESLLLFHLLSTKYTNLKNRLMQFPDATVKNWQKMGQTERKVLDEMLDEEFRSGGHVTELRQTNGVWEHHGGAALFEMLRKKGVDPESPRGQAMAQQILDIKNSLLKHINTLEQVAVGIAREQFAGQPSVLQMKVNEIAAEVRRYRNTPFFPQSHFGKHVLYVKARNPETGRMETVHLEHFESRSKRDRAEAEFRRIATAEQHIYSKDLTDSQYVQMTMPKEFLTTVAESGAFEPEQIQLLGDLLTPLRVGKMFERYEKAATKIRGASPDLMRNFADWSWHNANFIAKLEYNRKLKKAIGMTRHDALQARKVGDKATAYELERDLRLMEGAREYMMHPPAEWHKMRAVVSLLYLWGSVKTAALNLMGLVTTWAALTGEYGDLAGNRALIGSMKDLTAGKLSSAERWMVDQGIKDGLFDQSYAYFLAGQSNGGNLMRGLQGSLLGKTWQHALEGGMLPFRLVEMANRRVTALAIFRLELEKNKATGMDFEEARVDAYATAEQRTRLLQNDYSTANRVELTRGKAALFTVFFSFVQYMTWVMSGGYERGQRRQARNLGETPRSVATGMTVRLWIILAMMGGAEGLPFGENLMDVLDMIWRKLSGKSARQEMRELVAEMGGDPNIAMHGLGSETNFFGLLGDTKLDIAGSVGMGRIIPGTDVLGKEDDPKKMLGGFAMAAAGPTGGIVKDLMGLVLSDDPLGRRLAMNLPGAFGNVAKAIEYSKNGATTKSGLELARGDNGELRRLTPEELFAQALGFRSTAVSRGQELHYAKAEEKVYWTKRRGEVIRDYIRAVESREPEEMKAMAKAVEDFNSDLPSPSLRIVGKDLNTRIRARRKEVRKHEAGVVPKRYRDLFEQVDEAYGMGDGGADLRGVAATE